MLRCWFRPVQNSGDAGGPFLGVSLGNTLVSESTDHTLIAAGWLASAGTVVIRSANKAARTRARDIGISSRTKNSSLSFRGHARGYLTGDPIHQVIPF